LLQPRAIIRPLQAISLHQVGKECSIAHNVCTIVLWANKAHLSTLWKIKYTFPFDLAHAKYFYMVEKVPSKALVFNKIKQMKLKTQKSAIPVVQSSVYTFT